MAIYENGSIQYGIAMAINAHCTVNDTDMHYFKERDETFNQGFDYKVVVELICMQLVWSLIYFMAIRPGMSFIINYIS